jgi:hypothetical protein
MNKAQKKTGLYLTEFNSLWQANPGEKSAPAKGIPFIPDSEEQTPFKEADFNAFSLTTYCP